MNLLTSLLYFQTQATRIYLQSKFTMFDLRQPQNFRYIAGVESAVIGKPHQCHFPEGLDPAVKPSYGIVIAQHFLTQKLVKPTFFLL